MINLVLLSEIYFFKNFRCINGQVKSYQKSKLFSKYIWKPDQSYKKMEGLCALRYYSIKVLFAQRLCRYWTFKSIMSNISTRKSQNHSFKINPNVMLIVDILNASILHLEPLKTQCPSDGIPRKKAWAQIAITLG